MKRIGLLLLMVIFVVAMTGCSACNDNTTKKPIVPPPPPPPEPVYVDPVPTAPPIDTGAINLEDPIHFDFDKYNIRPDAAMELQDKAAYLQSRPSTAVQIQGHCDNRGTEAYNLALGDRRAHSTKKYMMDMGVTSDRMNTVSYGEEMPLDPSNNEQAWAANRRAQFIITSP